MSNVIGTSRTTAQASFIGYKQCVAVEVCKQSDTQRTWTSTSQFHVADGKHESRRHTC